MKFMTLWKMLMHKEKQSIKLYFTYDPVFKCASCKAKHKPQVHNPYETEYIIKMYVTMLHLKIECF